MFQHVYKTPILEFLKDFPHPPNERRKQFMEQQIQENEQYHQCYSRSFSYTIHIAIHHRRDLVLLQRANEAAHKAQVKTRVGKFLCIIRRASRLCYPRIGHTT